MARVGARVGRGWAAGLAVALLLAAGAGGWKAWPRRPDDLLARGRAAYERKDWQTAWTSARERLRAAPDDLGALQLLARSAGRLGRDDSARAIYKERLKMERMGGEDFYLLGASLVRERNDTAALVAMGEGLRLEPKHPELLQELTRLYAQQDDLARAAGLAERLAAVPGWEARGDLLGGILRAEQSDPAGAAERLERALTRDPALRGAAATPTEARKLLARARLQTGQAASAREALAPVVSARPDPEAEWLLSRALLQEGDLAAASAALGRSHGYEAGAAREPAPYVGAAKCGECHASVHRSQQNSLHARTFFPTSALSRVALPDKPVADPAAPGVVHTVSREGDRVRVETRAEGQVYRALVDYAIGSGDRGLTLVGRDDAGRHRELRLSRYNDGSGWDRTTGHPPHPRDPAEYLGLPLSADALRRCLGCHTTDARPALDRDGPTVADHGIGCERCHGPGGHHVRAVAAKFPDLAVARPQDFPAERLVKLCGQCHSPRGVEVTDTADKLNVRFQAATFVKSRCFTESDGALSCLTCHNPHRDAETSATYYESRCLMCHTPRKPAEAGTKPQTSCPVNPADGCLKCHMPVVTDAIPHSPFSDHHIRVHPGPTRR